MIMKCPKFSSPISGYQYQTLILGVGSGSACFQIGEMTKRLEHVPDGRNIDLVLVYGDTNSTLAGAICANKCNIKLGHIEAGLRSYD